MELSTILKWSTNLAKCFGYFPLCWNGQTVRRYGPIGDKLASIVIFGFEALYSYMLVGAVIEAFQDLTLIEDEITKQSMVGMVVRVILLATKIIAYNAELALSVLHRGRQMELLNSLLQAELEFTKKVSTANGNLRLFLVFIVGTSAIATMMFRFQLRIWSEPGNYLLKTFITWPEFGIFTLELNLLLQLMVLNRRFDLMTLEFDGSNEERYELFSIWQGCVTKLNHHYGVQFVWVLLLNFLFTLISVYIIVLNLVLREADLKWLDIIIDNTVSVAYLLAICSSAGQLSEKAKRVVSQQTQYIYYSQPTDQWSKATKLNLINLHKPKLEVFSASGYFTIDRTTFFSFVATITLYIFVMCQFKMDEDA